MEIKTNIIKLLSIILPHVCAICGERDRREKDLCLKCECNLPLNKSCCQQCALPIAKNSFLCGNCLKNKSHFNNAFAPYLYQDAIKKLVTDLKFNQQLVNAKVLGILLAKQIQKQNIEKPEILIPVPLYYKRLRKRGFNQALEIAKVVSKELNIPVDYACCKRIKNTLPQSEISAKKRKQNIKKAFAVTKNITCQHIAIIDDVMTTGSTVNELAKTLKKSGAKKIAIWCIARA